MTVGRPMLLVLLPVAVVLAAISLRGRGYGKGRLIFLGLLRTLLAVGVVLAPAGLSVLLPTPRRHVVFLIDESPSCAHRLASAEELVAERIGRLDADDVPVVFRFDRHAWRDESLTGGAVGERRREPASDVSEALTAALAAIPARHPGVVFLVTDGIETHGDAADAAVRLRGRGIPVYIPRPSAELPIDVRVSACEAPPVVGRGQSFRLACRVEATQPVRSGVEILRDGVSVHTQAVDVSPGSPTVISMVETLDGEGLHVYTARVTVPDDRFPQNNTLEVPVFVRAKPLVLYLTGFEGETPVDKLLTGLDRFRFRRLSSAGELTAVLLAETSVVVLDSFGAAGLGTKDREVASFVRDAGGGLVMVGGPGSFGVGGYIDTAVEKVLPVHCDPRDAEKKPLALVVVLDSSGSMGEGGGQKMEMARASAVRTLSRLAEKDLACVIAFRVTPEVVVPLAPVEDPGAVARKLAGVAPVGGTNIFPALSRALDEVRDTKLPLLHVVILSDGKTQPGDADGLVARFKTAGVTLSAVATGADADRGLLSRLAEGSGGRFYEAADIRQLPDLFLDDLRRIDGPLVRRGDLALEAGTPDEILKDIDLDGLPTVKAYNRTRAREGATVLLKHTFEKTPEPVLAVRRMGLGHAAALMLSFDRTWAGDFADWDPWCGVLMRLLQYTHRSEPIDHYALTVHREGGAFEIRVADNSFPESTEGRTFAMRLTPLSGTTVEVPLERTGVRSYCGEAETDLEGVVSAVLVEAFRGGVRPIISRYVPDAYAREFRELTPRLDKLEQIARITGGRLVDNLEEFRAAGGTGVRDERDLTWWLLALVLVLFLTELVGRALGRL